METEYDITLKKIIVLVSECTGIEESELNENTKIEDDVGLAGLDTFEFYERFFTDFQIENPQDFNSDKFISPENIDLFTIIKSIFSKNIRQKFTLKNNTIKHLTNVALIRKWYEEQESSL